MIDIQLQDGLRLRQATLADADAVAKFNAKIHEEPGEEGKIGPWTHDLMSGRHPTTQAADFLLVETAEGEVVSTTVNIPQVWHYEDVEFKVGRPELVGTDENWRKRGLVRQQFEALHQMSEANGDLMQVITGIPWYYRQFGYSHALDLGGGRQFDLDRPGNVQPVKPEDEKFLWRDATVDDIPSLQKYYAVHGQNYLLNSGRDAALWRFVLEEQSPDSLMAKPYWIISYQDGRPAGYIGFAHWPHATVINEIGCEPTQSLREFTLFVIRAIKKHIEDKNEAKAEGEKPISKRLIFYCGREHAVYRALERQLGDTATPYAWYIRIPDIPAFLSHIRPVLERRLANSVMVGHSGQLRVSLYRETFTLDFKDGKITEVGTFEPKSVSDGDLVFTRPEFIQLVCGHKSFEELNNTHVDCHCRGFEARILTEILFPKIASNPMGVN